MEDVTKIRIKELIGALTTPQLWAVGAAVVGVFGATLAMGFAVANYKAKIEMEGERTRHVTALEQLKDSHSKVISKLERSIEKAKTEATEAESALALADSVRNSALLKATFLNHYVRYLIAEKHGGEDLKRAHRMFANFVHLLWVAQEENTVDLVLGEVTKKKKVRVMVEKPVNVQPFGVQRPARYEWRDQNVTERIIKVVNFSDGSSYVVPESVASDVHNR